MPALRRKLRRAHITVIVVTAATVVVAISASSRSHLADEVLIAQRQMKLLQEQSSQITDNHVILLQEVERLQVELEAIRQRIEDER